MGGMGGDFTLTADGTVGGTVELETEEVVWLVGMVSTGLSVLAFLYHIYIRSITTHFIHKSLTSLFYYDSL